MTIMCKPNYGCTYIPMFVLGFIPFVPYLTPCYLRPVYCTNAGNCNLYLLANLNDVVFFCRRNFLSQPWKWLMMVRKATTLPHLLILM